MKDWWSALTYHHEYMRQRFPAATLVLLFDIDGTLIESGSSTTFTPREQINRAMARKKTAWESLFPSPNSPEPIAGVFEAVRWFQVQPGTRVALNSGRSEHSRLETLRSLNQLGQHFGVNFRPEDLFLNSGDTGSSIEAVKLAGIRHFRRLGYRVISMVDSEPSNLRYIAKVDDCRGIVLFHAGACQAGRGADRGTRNLETAMDSSPWPVISIEKPALL